jgi:hypothetical protein
MRKQGHRGLTLQSVESIIEKKQIIMRNYNLGFITDENIFAHVKATVLNYRRSINLKEFNKNIIDPIKLTFDAKIYVIPVYNFY